MSKKYPLLRDLLANRPAASIKGRLFSTTDGGQPLRIYQDTGSTWELRASIDHGDLTGLADDDHTLYALSDGTRLRVYRSTTAPSSPSAGQLWADTNTNPPTLKDWTGSAWEAIGGGSGSAAAASIDGVSNTGGNIDFVAGTGMTITPDDTANTITFAASGGGGGSTIPFNDDVALVQDATDNTKKMRIEAGSIGASQTRVLTMPNADVNLGALVDANIDATLKDGSAGSPTMRSLGTSGSQAAAGNDSRITGALPTTGGTLTGALVLSGDAAAALNPLSLQQFQARPYKDPVVVATTANITLSGTQTIDGVAVTAGQRVLVKDQSTGSQNGIYVVAAGAWSRATGADTTAKLASGLIVFVQQGQRNIGHWRMTNTTAPTLATTALTFARVSYNEIPFSDGNTTLATGDVPIRWRAPFDITIVRVEAVIYTPTAGASLIADLKRAASGTPATLTTIYTTTGNRPTIAAAAYSSGSATLPDTVNISAGDYLVATKAQVGSTSAGGGFLLQVGWVPR